MMNVIVMPVIRVVSPQGAKMNSDSVIQQPGSAFIQPGDSATLNCSVHTEHCAGEHTRVVWLKSSESSAPEMIYSSGYENATCERTEIFSEKTICVYKLLVRNFRSADAGTYYCAVTACGEILFGNGSRLQISKMTMLTVESSIVQDAIVFNYLEGWMMKCWYTPDL